MVASSDGTARGSRRRPLRPGCWLLTLGAMAPLDGGSGLSTRTPGCHSEESFIGLGTLLGLSGGLLLLRAAEPQSHSGSSPGAQAMAQPSGTRMSWQEERCSEQLCSGGPIGATTHTHTLTYAHAQTHIHKTHNRWTHTYYTSLHICTHAHKRTQYTDTCMLQYILHMCTQTYMLTKHTHTQRHAHYTHIHICTQVHTCTHTFTHTAQRHTYHTRNIDTHTQLHTYAPECNVCQERGAPGTAQNKQQPLEGPPPAAWTPVCSVSATLTHTRHQAWSMHGAWHRVMQSGWAGNVLTERPGETSQRLGARGARAENAYKPGREYHLWFHLAAVQGGSSK